MSGWSRRDNGITSQVVPPSIPNSRRNSQGINSPKSAPISLSTTSTKKPPSKSEVRAAAAAAIAATASDDRQHRLEVRQNLKERLHATSKDDQRILKDMASSELVELINNRHDQLHIALNMFPEVSIVHMPTIPNMSSGFHEAPHYASVSDVNKPSSPYRQVDGNYYELEVHFRVNYSSSASAMLVLVIGLRPTFPMSTPILLCAKGREWVSESSPLASFLMSPSKLLSSKAAIDDCMSLCEILQKISDELVQGTMWDSMRERNTVVVGGYDDEGEFDATTASMTTKSSKIHSQLQGDNNMEDDEEMLMKKLATAVTAVMNDDQIMMSNQQQKSHHLHHKTNHDSDDDLINLEKEKTNILLNLIPTKATPSVASSKRNSPKSSCLLAPQDTPRLIKPSSSPGAVFSSQNTQEFELDPSTPNPQISVIPPIPELPLLLPPPTSNVSRYLTDFEEVKVLGRGGFGCVTKVRHRLDRRYYAVKKVELPFEPELRARVLAEASRLPRLQHPHIVRYYNAWIEEEAVSQFVEDSVMINDNNHNHQRRTSSCDSQYLPSLMRGFDSDMEQNTNDYIVNSRGTQIHNALHLLLHNSGGGNPNEDDYVLKKDNNRRKKSKKEERRSGGGGSGGKNKKKKREDHHHHHKKKGENNYNRNWDDDDEEDDDENGVVFFGEEGGEEGEEDDAEVENYKHVEKSVNVNAMMPAKPQPSPRKRRKQRRRGSFNSDNDDDGGMKIFDGATDDDKKNLVKRDVGVLHPQPLSSIFDGTKITPVSSARQHPPLPTTRSFLYIQMEFCAGDTLRAAIDQNRINDGDVRWRMLRQILEAVDFMHDKGLIHRDLKPANILLDKNGDVKCGDFGLAAVTQAPQNITSSNHPTPVALSSSNFHQTSNSTTSNHPQQPQLSGGVGTLFYTAPEVENSQNYDSKADMFAIGVILFEMWRPPFSTDMERCHVLRNLTRDRFLPKDFSAPGNVLTLIKSLLHPDPSMRPSAEGVLRSSLLPPAIDPSLMNKVLSLVANPYTVEFAQVITILFNKPDAALAEAKAATYCSDRGGSENPSWRLQIVRDEVCRLAEHSLRLRGAIRTFVSVLEPLTEPMLEMIGGGNSGGLTQQNNSSPHLIPVNSDRDVKSDAVVYGGIGGGGCQLLIDANGNLLHLPVSLLMGLVRTSLGAPDALSVQRRFALQPVYFENFSSSTSSNASFPLVGALVPKSSSSSLLAPKESWRLAYDVSISNRDKLMTMTGNVMSSDEVMALLQVEVITSALLAASCCRGVQGSVYVKWSDALLLPLVLVSLGIVTRRDQLKALCRDLRAFSSQGGSGLFVGGVVGSPMTSQASIATSTTHQSAVLNMLFGGSSNIGPQEDIRKILSSNGIPMSHQNSKAFAAILHHFLNIENNELFEWLNSLVKVEGDVSKLLFLMRSSVSISSAGPSPQRSNAINELSSLIKFLLRTQQLMTKAAPLVLGSGFRLCLPFDERIFDEGFQFEIRMSFGNSSNDCGCVDTGQNLMGNNTSNPYASNSSNNNNTININNNLMINSNNITCTYTVVGTGGVISTLAMATSVSKSHANKKFLNLSDEGVGGSNQNNTSSTTSSSSNNTSQFAKRLAQRVWNKTAWVLGFEMDVEAIATRLFNGDVQKAVKSARSVLVDDQGLMASEFDYNNMNNQNNTSSSSINNTPLSNIINNTSSTNQNNTTSTTYQNFTNQNINQNNNIITYIHNSTLPQLNSSAIQSSTALDNSPNYLRGNDPLASGWALPVLMHASRAPHVLVFHHRVDCLNESVSLAELLIRCEVAADFRVAPVAQLSDVAEAIRRTPTLLCVVFIKSRGEGNTVYTVRSVRDRIGGPDKVLSQKKREDDKSEFTNELRAAKFVVNFVKNAVETGREAAGVEKAQAVLAQNQQLLVQKEESAAANSDHSNRRKSKKNKSKNGDGRPDYY